MSTAIELGKSGYTEASVLALTITNNDQKCDRHIPGFLPNSESAHRRQLRILPDFGDQFDLAQQKGFAIERQLDLHFQFRDLIPPDFFVAGKSELKNRFLPA
jgi:hypothetical protein